MGEKGTCPIYLLISYDLSSSFSCLMTEFLKLPSRLTCNAIEQSVERKRESQCELVNMYFINYICTLGSV